MSNTVMPRILFVDDEETFTHNLNTKGHAQSRAKHPDDVDEGDLQWADLVLVDFIIDNWSARDELEQLALRPSNGLALAAVLRERADSLSGGNEYTAFAIHTGHIEDISRRLHTTNRVPHVVARLNNLEWVFDKASVSRFEQWNELAAAVRTISDFWQEVENGGLEVAAKRLLGLSTEGQWHSRALDDVVLCQVPLSDFSAGTNGLLFLRWLLHSVLPYPTFLLAEQWIAARLRITPSALRAVLQGNSVLATDLATCRYDGILHSFLGRRWWRAGVEQYAWKIRAQGGRDQEAFHRELEERAGTELERLDLTSPVVCVDRELLPIDDIFSIENVVRMVPDLWPAYAGTSYASISSVRDDPDFAAVVHPLDRDRVRGDLINDRTEE